MARIFVYRSGGCRYPNPEHARETVCRESRVQAIEEVTRATTVQAQRMMVDIERLGDKVKRDGVSDIVDIFNQILVILGLPGTDVSPEHVELREHSLGQMSDLLTCFHHAVRRATPKALYHEVTPRNWADPASAVQVMTIHQAKGLEFPITFIQALAF